MTAVSSAALAKQVREFVDASGWVLTWPVRQALDRLVAELDSERQARENAERDAAIKDRAMTDYFADASQRADAAEAARDRLAGALREALDCKGPYGGLVSETGGEPAICRACQSVIRSALAAAGSGGNTEETT